MRCKLCGHPTGRFLQIYHQECMNQLHAEFSAMDAVVTKYEIGNISYGVAKNRLIEAAME